MTTCVALIPARAGSKRLPGKNIKPLWDGRYEWDEKRKLPSTLGLHPLIAYTIAAATQSGIFTEVIVSTEDDETASIALDYGARVIGRPAELATDTSPDIDWVRHALGGLSGQVDCFSILRRCA